MHIQPLCPPLSVEDGGAEKLNRLKAKDGNVNELNGLPQAAVKQMEQQVMQPNNGGLY